MYSVVEPTFQTGVLFSIIKILILRIGMDFSQFCQVIPCSVSTLLYLCKYIVCTGGSDGKESACNAGHLSSIPGLGREMQPTSVFLPGESHGQRSLEGYSPWGQKESDPTE